MPEHDPARELLTTPLLDEDLVDLYENAPCGYLSTLPDGLVARVNGTFLRWTGYERDGLVGRKRFSELLTIGGRIFYETHFAPLLRMQGFVKEIAVDLVRADGNRMPVLVNAHETPRRPDAPPVVRITVFDATDRRAYERELVQARDRAEETAQARAGLLSTMSHDVRAPLTAILTAAALLERSNHTPQQAKFIAVLRSSSNQALALVNSMLDLSRLDAGQATRREQPFDLVALVRDVMSTVEVIASQKPDLQVKLTIEEGLPLLVGDPEKLTQVLMNLATNAVKFTERGFVSVIVAVRELTDETATLEVLVSDTGIGIPADRLPHIFDEYTQAGSQISQKYGGAGLGLAISRRLLLLYGSELHVSSTVGQGTTFSFVLQLPRANG